MRISWKSLIFLDKKSRYSTHTVLRRARVTKMGTTADLTVVRLFKECCTNRIESWPKRKSVVGRGAQSRVNAANYQEILERLHASVCWQALWRCWFPISAGLPTVSKLAATVLPVKPSNTVVSQPTHLSPIENLQDIIERKMRDTGANNTDELKAAISPLSVRYP